MVTPRLCAVVMPPDRGDGHGGGDPALVTVTEAVPEALLYAAELPESGVYFAVNVSAPAASEPAGIVTVAEPEPSGG